MKHIGYFYIREIDSIRYDIYQNNDNIFALIKNKFYKINLPKKYQNLNEKIHITLTDILDYEDYENFLKKNKPPSYIKINNEKIQNNNIINFIL
jgi:hypothetical protein